MFGRTNEFSKVYGTPCDLTKTECLSLIGKTYNKDILVRQRHTLGYGGIRTR